MNLTSCLKCDSKCMLLECLKNPLICIRLATEFAGQEGGVAKVGVCLFKFSNNNLSKENVIVDIRTPIFPIYTSASIYHLCIFFISEK